MIEIYENQIEDEIVICNYCGKDWHPRNNYRGCCGEVHPITAYLLVNNAVDIRGFSLSEDYYNVENVLVHEFKENLSIQEKIDILADLELDQRRNK